MITAENIRQLLHYDPATGILTWLVTRGKAIKGSAAGSKDKHGYICLGYGGKEYKAHRVIWLYMTGEWPIAVIDHINCLPGDNRWDNLRCKTQGVNSQNTKRARINSKTGVLGVSPVGKKFVAQIVANGEHNYLGIFPTVEEASAAYLEAKRRLHEGCTI